MTEDRISRRTALGRGALAAGAVLLPGAAAACSEPEPQDRGDDAAVAAIVASRDPRLPRRAAPWRLTRSVRVPAGTTLTIDPGTRIVWAGARSAPGGVAVFEAGGDDVGIVVPGGGTATVECAEPAPGVHACGMRGRRGLTVTGIQAVNCGHVFVNADAPVYAAVVTTGARANVARDVRITGGGARFDRLQTAGPAAVNLWYVIGVRVADARYDNAVHGIEWWGGDSDLGRDGARTNERKCRDLLIERVTVRGAQGGGIWGSMGRDIVVRDCAASDCLDLCFDAEGSVDVLFERCTARDGTNGCFASFFLCTNVRFVDCRGTVADRRRPLFRVFNASQSSLDNLSVEVAGGRFECTDPTGPGTMDTASGPVRDLTIRAATLVNVRIDTAFVNMHRTRILDNDLSFTVGIGPQAAIRAGGSGAAGDARGAVAAGSVTIRGNTLRYAPRAGRGGDATAIEVREWDYNSAAAGSIAGNRVTGPFAVGVAVVNATGNAGIVPVVDVAGNAFAGLAAGARRLVVRAEGPQARPPVVRWDARQGPRG